MIDPDGRERDRVGRVQPHQFNVVGIHRAVPGLLGLFSEKVPPRFYAGARRGVRDRCIVAVLCPGCGARVQFRPGRPFHPCDCGRWYLEHSGRVRCAVLPGDELAEAA